MHIGKHIRKVVEKQGRTHSWLAHQLNMVRPNIYNIYNRSSIDTELLQRISIILGYNFLHDLASETNQEIERQKKSH